MKQEVGTEEMTIQEGFKDGYPLKKYVLSTTPP